MGVPHGKFALLCRNSLPAPPRAGTAPAAVGDEADELVDLLVEEMLVEGLLGSAVGMVVKLATSGDFKATAGVLRALVDATRSDWSGQVCKRIMEAGSEGGGMLEYGRVCMILGQLLDSGRALNAYETLRALVAVPEGNEEGDEGEEAQASGGFDCTHAAFILGNMVELGRADWAGALAHKAYSEEAHSGGELAQLLPYMLGGLLDYQQASWVSAIAQQLLYSPTDPAATDYGCLGWALAQMVWLGRPDWAATVATDLAALGEAWYDPAQLMAAVRQSSGGDASYVQAIQGSMQQGGSGGGYDAQSYYGGGGGQGYGGYGGYRGRGGYGRGGRGQYNGGGGSSGYGHHQGYGANGGGYGGQSQHSPRGAGAGRGGSGGFSPRSGPSSGGASPRDSIGSLPSPRGVAAAAPAAAAVAAAADGVRKLSISAPANKPPPAAGA